MHYLQLWHLDIHRLVLCCPLLNMSGSCMVIFTPQKCWHRQKRSRIWDLDVSNLLPNISLSWGKGKSSAQNALLLGIWVPRRVHTSSPIVSTARKFSSDWLQPRDPQQYPPILMEADLMICRQEKMVGCVFCLFFLQRFLETRKYTIPRVAYRVAIGFFQRN